MPRTSTGHPYRVREREGRDPCLVCGVEDRGEQLVVVMELPLDERREHFAFPICSVVCMVAWTELMGRVLDGDDVAPVLALSLLMDNPHNA